MPKEEKIVDFNSPYGRIRVKERYKRHQDSSASDNSLLHPYYDDPDPKRRSIHHHLYFDSKRPGVLGLAYTRDDETREYWIDDGYGWQRQDEYDFKAFLRNIVTVALGLAVVPAKIRQEKEELCRKAEKLNQSTEWKETAEALKRLQTEYKALGFTGKESDGRLWNHFKAAIDVFYQRRKQYFDNLDQQKKENCAKKEALCKEAEHESSSSDWKAGSEAFKRLRERWKQVGSSGKEHEDALWKRFCAAQNTFYDRQKQFYQENLRRKESLCFEAEILTNNHLATAFTGIIGFGDVQAAVKRVKELQTEWKQVGSVPREEADKLWNRFKNACDRVFLWANEERKQKQREWQNKMMEILERKRSQASNLQDSINHDETVLSRKNESYYNVRPGGRADEIRESIRLQIRSLEEKISSKKRRLDDLEASIRDIQSKL